MFTNFHILTIFGRDLRLEPSCFCKYSNMDFLIPKIFDDQTPFLPVMSNFGSLIFFQFTLIFYNIYRVEVTTPYLFIPIFTKSNNHQSFFKVFIVSSGTHFLLVHHQAHLVPDLLQLVLLRLQTFLFRHHRHPNLYPSLF